MIVEDVVTLLMIILYKINYIRTFNAQLTLRGYVMSYVPLSKGDLISNILRSWT
ncbi:hypothetical protein BH18THE2_BH18THE2_29230 [soil metagenome]